MGVREIGRFYIMKAYVEKRLARILKRGSVVFVGAGNSIRGDDGVGPYVILKLKAYSLKLKAIDAGDMPENYIKTVAGLKPRTVALIDAVDFGAEAGQIEVFQADKIKDTTVSTHNMSLKLFSEHIKQLIGSEVLLIGIQPHSVKFGEGLSGAVKKTADELIGVMGGKKHA